MKNTFTSLVSKANSILIAGHLEPDYDAYATMLFVYNIIKENFPSKTINMNLDSVEPFNKLSFLPSFEKIQYKKLTSRIEELKPDLVVLVDGNDRKERFAPDINRFEILTESIPIIVIDHHPIRETEFDLFYQLERGSAVEVAYDLLIRKENLSKFEGWEETYLVGMIGDSYRFYYPYPGYRENFDVVSEILDGGKWTLREISDRLFSFSKDEMILLSELFKNIVVTDKFAYSTLSWEIYKDKFQNKLTKNLYKNTKRYFVDNFLNKINDISICFTLSPHVMQGDEKIYTGSFRSRPKTYDCSMLASQFPEGGGHITGAGFSFSANSFQEALEKVLNVLSSKLDKSSVK